MLHTHLQNSSLKSCFEAPAWVAFRLREQKIDRTVMQSDTLFASQQDLDRPANFCRAGVCMGLRQTFTVEAEFWPLDPELQARNSNLENV